MTVPCHDSKNGTVEREYLRRKGVVELRYLRTAIKKLTYISTLHWRWVI